MYANALTARLQFFPSVFAEGTDAKDYETFSHDAGDWTPDLEPLRPPDSIDEWDLKKSDGEDWQALITHDLEEGDAFVKTRGKEIAFGGGFVSLPTE